MGDADALVSVEKDGRILSGVGTTEADLKTTLDRRTPESAMPDADAQPTPPGSFRAPRAQKRFDQIAFERGEAQRRADAAEARNRDLEAQLAEARRPPTPAPAAAAPPPPPPPSSSPVQPQPPSGNGFPRFDMWFAQNPTKDFDDYIRDLQRHNLDSQGYVRQTDLDALVQQGIERDRETRTRHEREGQEIARGRAVYGSEFDRFVSAPHMMAGNWPMYLVDAINGRKEPEHIKVALGKDPVLAEKIRTMNPVYAAYELDKLDASAAVAPTAPTVRTMAPTPPAPMQPVGGGGRSTAPSSADLAMRSSDFDYDKSGYREARARERGVKSRR